MSLEQILMELAQDLLDRNLGPLGAAAQQIVDARPR
jgi:hypothetical protein